jgi:hypothetical protein
MMRHHENRLVPLLYPHPGLASPVFAFLTALLLTLPVAVRAEDRFLFWADPIGDNTSSADVSSMLLVFDHGTGNYTITLRSTPDHPFVGQFRVSVNLWNADASTFFFDNLNDFDLATPATTLRLTGTSSILSSWQVGQRVVTSTEAGLGAPNVFHCAVLDLPLTSIKVDEIAVGPPGIAPLRELTACQAAVFDRPDLYVRGFVRWEDPVGDQTGSIDVTQMELLFDPASGNYTVTLRATPEHPFVGLGLANVNLWNPDAGTFFVPSFGFNLATPTTIIQRTGTAASLLRWQAGQRVATSTLAGVGNPGGGITFFRSGVRQFAPPNVFIGEDNIAFDASGLTAVGWAATPLAVASPAEVRLECTGSEGLPAGDDQLTSLFAGVTAMDACDENPVVTHDAPSTFPFGATVVTFTARDGLGNTALCQTTVNVVDSKPPVLTVEVDPTTLWPPNHQMVSLHPIITAVDACEPNPGMSLVSVTSDEPDQGLGDGDHPGDIMILGLEDIELRAERQAGGAGRHYTLLYRAWDGSGDTSEVCRTVVVPHDQSGQAALLAGPGIGARELVVWGSPATHVRDIIPGTVQVRTAAFQPVMLASNLPSYADRNGDEMEDAVYSLAVRQPDAPDEGAESAPSAAGLYARWEIAGTGYLANLDPSVVTDVDMSRLPDRPSAAVRPNPALAEAAIDLALPTESHVRLSIYDVTGRLVAHVVDGMMPAGRHQVRWAGSKRSGAQFYLFRMEAAGRLVTGRFILLN